MKKLVLTLFMVMASWSLFADNATFPGGEAAMTEYITTNLKYPTPAADNGIEGVVEVRFTVKPDGTIGTIKIVRMVDPDLEQEAIRLVKNMPAWTPATENGTPVASEQTVKIPFALNP